MSRSSAYLAGAALLWGVALLASGGEARGLPAQKTTNDGIYTSSQADRARAQYDAICADCHAFTAAAQKEKPAGNPPLGGDRFFRKWAGRAVDELVSTIVLTMPNDGSAVVSEEEAVDLVAYILQQNGYRGGDEPLTVASAEGTVLVRPEK